VPIGAGVDAMQFADCDAVHVNGIRLWNNLLAPTWDGLIATNREYDQRGFSGGHYPVSNAILDRKARTVEILFHCCKTKYE